MQLPPRSLHCAVGFGILALTLFGFGSYGRALDLSDTEVKEEMGRRSSLFCPGFSNDRALPGIRAVKVEALRVLIEHRYTLCPNRRITNPTGVIWNSRWGVFLWNPANQKSVEAMAKQADTFTHTMEFPNELMVYDLDGKPLKCQTVPAFELAIPSPASSAVAG